jgi:hypothetical protein
MSSNKELVLRLSIESDSHSKEINFIKVSSQDDTFVTKVDINAHVLALMRGRDKVYYRANILDNGEFIIIPPMLEGLIW